MDKAACRTGMKVLFGRENGGHTLAEVIKMNPRKAKVRTLEHRGYGRGSSVGAIWNVPYSMMRPAVGEKPTVPPVRHGGFGEKVPIEPKTQTFGNGIDVTVGEYRVYHDEDDDLTADRNGVRWKDLVGDNLVLALATEVARLREEVMALENA